MATHAARGVEMVSDIDFLRDSTEAILHHHERMDGLGYPAGLRGEEIPLPARIIAVADAFDSLTTSRSHREARTVEEAVAELHQRAGTQFDRVVVAALERGLGRQGWEPPRVEPTLRVSTGRAFDHDDPESSDLMAGLAITGLEDLRPAEPGLAEPGLAEPGLAEPGLAEARLADIERSQ